MSWGERSCKTSKKNGGCGHNPKLQTCNVDCIGYEWDGITAADSVPQASLRFISNESGILKKNIPKIARNALCPCGSGKKYKRCCL
jgi:hypothetical protein